MHGHTGMLASELIATLQDLIAKHGDQRVVCTCDHDPVAIVRYEPESWVGIAAGETRPAFELDQWF